MMLKTLSLVTLFLMSLNAFAQKKVAIVDSGLDITDIRFKNALCASGHKDFTGEGLRDTNGHGTHMAGIIRRLMGSDSCLIILKYHSDRKATNSTAEAVAEAVRLGASVVNLSSVGPGIDKKEYEVMRQHPEVLFVVAAGNEGLNLDASCNQYPVCYNLPNILGVGSLNRNNNISTTSNFSKKLVWELGENIVSDAVGSGYSISSGTSEATALRTGKIIHE